MRAGQPRPLVRSIYSRTFLLIVNEWQESPFRIVVFTAYSARQALRPCGLCAYRATRMLKCRLMSVPNGRNLAYNSLSGTIPSSLGSITTVKQLCDEGANAGLLYCLTDAANGRDVSNNNLSGSIPSSLGNLVALTYMCEKGRANP